MKFTRRMLATSMIAAASATGLALGLSATAAAEPAAPAPRPGPERARSAVPPAARDQSGRGDAAHAGLHVAAQRRAGRRPRCRRPTCTGRNGVGHPSAACGSGRRARAPAAAPAVPAAAPAAAAAPATAAQNLIPSGEVNVPSVPFLPVPLPQQVSFPGDLAALMPSGLMPGAKLAAAPAPRRCGRTLSRPRQRLSRPQPRLLQPLPRRHPR